MRVYLFHEVASSFAIEGDRGKRRRYHSGSDLRLRRAAESETGGKVQRGDGVKT